MPGGLQRNKQFRMPMINVDDGCPSRLLDVLFDPQTAGGLLISLAAAEADNLLTAMHRAGLTDAAIVGEVVSGAQHGIHVLCR